MSYGHEAARAVVDHTPLTPAEEADLRHQARIRSTHYSTQIEGNRLTLSEAQQVIEGKKGKFHGVNGMCERCRIIGTPC